MDYAIERMNPTALEYKQIRELTGLTPRGLDACATALSHSLFAVCLRDQSGELIGLGRVVGDLGSHVQIVDIAVKPEHQGQGLSHVIMGEVMNFVANNVSDCAFVNLFADVDFLYHKYGFRYPKAKGMYLDRRCLSQPC